LVRIDILKILRVVHRCTQGRGMTKAPRKIFEKPC
jgi:hypothetical protein